MHSSELASRDTRRNSDLCTVYNRVTLFSTSSKLHTLITIKKLGTKYYALLVIYIAEAIDKEVYLRSCVSYNAYKVHKYEIKLINIVKTI